VEPFVPNQKNPLCPLFFVVSWQYLKLLVHNLLIIATFPLNTEGSKRPKVKLPFLTDFISCSYAELSYVLHNQTITATFLRTHGNPKRAKPMASVKRRTFLISCTCAKLLRIILSFYTTEQSPQTSLWTQGPQREQVNQLGSITRTPCSRDNLALFAPDIATFLWSQ
jgi:hypothetical protein